MKLLVYKNVWFVSVNFLAILVGQNISSSKASDEILELLKLDLSHLVDVSYTSVSAKFDEPVADSSSSVTIYSATDLDQLGYFTIGDLADITPGYSSHIRFGERVLETRGQKAASFNNDKHLLLVDGVPIRHTRNFKVPTENEMPLFFANKAEFLRGPASALYGTNAFFGVVSIKPKEYEMKGLKLEGRIEGGTPDSPIRAMVNAFYNSNWGNSTLSLSFFRKDASKDFVGVTKDPDWRFYDNQQSEFAYFKHRFIGGLMDGLSIGVVYNKKNGGIGEYWVGGRSYSSNDLTWETVSPYIKYEKEILESLNFSGFVKYNRSWETGNVVINPQGPRLRQLYKSDSEDYETQGELSYNFSEKTNIILGINYLARRELGFPDSRASYLTTSGLEPIPGFDTKTTEWLQNLSGYSQIRHELDFLHGTIFTIGGRYTAGKFKKQNFNNFSPRIGVVQKLRSDLNLKLQYSKAYRSPGIKEQSFNIEKNVTPLPTLHPEIFETKEIGLVYHRQNLLMELAVFYNSTKDTIDFITESQFRNLSGKIKSIGGEFIVNYNFENGLGINLNYSYANSTAPDHKDLDDIPIHKANLILRYTDTVRNMPYHATVINRWIHNYSVSNDQLKKPNGHFTTDINLGLQISNRMKLGIQVRNLFDADYKIPNNGLREIPMPKRSVWGHLTVNY